MVNGTKYWGTEKLIELYNLNLGFKLLSITIDHYRQKKSLSLLLSLSVKISLSLIPAFQYVQIYLTGRHIASGGEDFYDLVCVCIQTYNTRIYGIQNRKIESISLALAVLIQEFGPLVLFTCDREGAFQQLAKELHPIDLGALESTHRVLLKFSVANRHFSTGLVERRIKTIHDYIGKLKMQGSGMSVTDMSLMFQYVVFQINSVPYGIRNIRQRSSWIPVWLYAICSGIVAWQLQKKLE